MKVLYIFPHPDDESFGPAVAMSKQRREGHEVYLLTLTRGEATKVRHTLGLSKEEMGRIREAEMREVAKVLSLNDLTVLDLPDGALKEMDPRIIETAIENHINTIRPDVVVTYAVHGISGFHDHLVTHSVVKRVFEAMKEKTPSPKRLALYSLTEEDARKSQHFTLSFSKTEEIDCFEECSQIDIKKNIDALDCYTTYAETITASGIKQIINKNVAFEFYKENFSPPLRSIFESI
jgi:LmbE family N-acetylglucosaminyl deacetylase